MINNKKPARPKRLVLDEFTPLYVKSLARFPIANETELEHFKKTAVRMNYYNRLPYWVTEGGVKIPMIKVKR